MTLSFVAAAYAGDKASWIPTWTASPQPAWSAEVPFPLGLPSNLYLQTVRQVARVSVGGSQVRVVLSNAYGQSPLVVGAAHIGLTADGADIRPGSGRVLTFGGKSSVTIPPGAPVISDPVDMAVVPLSKVSVSLYFPDSAPTRTLHFDGHQAAYLAAGNKVADTRFLADSTITQRPFLSAIWVDAPAEARAIVAFGDSITDGDGSTLNGNDRWPDRLAQRLVEPGGPPVAVLNQGISGARVLSTLMGENALARFERDVLSQPHVDTVVLMMGINDIGMPG